MKKSRRILSLLLCCLLLVGLLPTVALAADTEITSVSVTGIKAPVVGQTVAENIASISVASDADYTIERVIWWRASVGSGWSDMSESASFNSTDLYYYQIYLEPKTGYVFPNGEHGTGVWREYNGTVSTSELDYASSDVFLNEDDLYNGYLSISGKGISALSPITKVAVTGMPTTITAGASTAISADDVTITTEPADAADVLTICWQNKTDDFTADSTFKAGKEYVLGIHFQPKEGYYFEFDETADEYYIGEATFNGEEPDIAWSAYSGVTHAYTDFYTRSKPMTPIENYDLWVDGGTQVTFANKDDVLGDGTVSYDPATNTLTLSDYDGSYIKADMPLDIVLADGTENTVSVPVEVGYTGIRTVGNCTLSGKGNLDIHSTGNDIYANSGDLTINMSGDLSVSSPKSCALTSDGYITISGSGDVEINAKAYGLWPEKDVILSGSGKLTVTSSEHAVCIDESGKSLLLNGTGTPISLKAGTGKAAVWNKADSNSPVGGTNLSYYNRITGAPDESQVVYDHTAVINTIPSIDITGADITPVLGEKAGDHLAFTLPADCHYTATMNGWWDIINSKIMANDDVFEAGGLYCASWNFVADDGYAFNEDTAVTINGSDTNVDTEHSYLDTTGEDPLYIISAKGVLVEPVTYTVTFDVGDHGTAPVDQTVKENDKATKPADPTASGWTFGGWYADATFSAEFDFNTAINADTTVYAKWTENTVTPPTPVNYTITFNMNGHGTQITAQTVEDGSMATKPADPKASGYTFGGWYADATFSTKFDFNTAITANTTIYAKWTKNSVAPTDPTSPQTGDNSHMLLWLIILSASGAALTGTAIYSRKKKKTN